MPPALMALDNVVLAPHMASGTHETRAAMTALTLQNLDAFLADGRVLTPVL
ncbi:Glyoxylate/hydroxypyruvate reductase B [compost metagenome]